MVKYLLRNCKKGTAWTNYTNHLIFSRMYSIFNNSFTMTFMPTNVYHNVALETFLEIIPMYDILNDIWFYTLYYEQIHN